MHASREDGRAGALATPLLLAAIAVSSIILRTWFSSEVLPPPPRMQGETTQAYRYARMISEGLPVPSTDTLVMHPGGMDTSENSIFEEYAAGWLHRITGGPFDRFIRWFCLILPVTGIFGLYLWLRETGSGRRTALLGAHIYGFMLPALLRTRGESLYRETLALPVLMMLLWAVERSTRAADARRALPSSIAAAVLLAVACASWKVTGFISAGMLFYILVRRTRAGTPLPAVLLPAAAQLACAALVPHMVHDGAILSAASVVAAALAVSAVQRFTALPLLAALGAAAVTFLHVNPALAHVGEMIAAKLQFMFRHPADPALLSPDARLFWVAGYETPSAGQILLLFGPLLVVAAFGARKLWRRGPSLARWALPVSLAAYLVMDRLHVLLAVAVIPAMLETIRQRWRYPALALMVFLHSITVVPASGLLEGAGLPTSSSPSLLTETELEGFLGWTGRSVGQDEAVMCYWHISGFVSAYADRPVVTHTFFENSGNRATIQEFAARMFQEEDSLAAFMERHDARILVYQADFLLDRSTGGLMYLAGLTGPPEGCAAVLLHYRPEDLERFVPVFQGQSLRVFRLDGGEGVETAPGILFEERFDGLFADYDRALAVVADPSGTAWSLAMTGRRNGAPDLLSAALLLTAGSGGARDDATGILQELVMLHLDDRYPIDALTGDFRTYLEAFGPDPLLRMDLARLQLQAGQHREALEEIAEAVEEAPWLLTAEEFSDLVSLLPGGGGV